MAIIMFLQLSSENYQHDSAKSVDLEIEYANEINTYSQEHLKNTSVVSDLSRPCGPPEICLLIT